MDRLTKRMENGRVVCAGINTGYLTTLTKLAEYEDTGMSPGEIRRLYQITDEMPDNKDDEFIKSLSDIWSGYIGSKISVVDTAALLVLLNVLKTKWGYSTIEEYVKLVKFVNGGIENV